MKLFEEKKPWYKYYINMKKHIKYPDISMYEQIKRTALNYSLNIAYSYYGIKVSYKNFLKDIDECAEAFIRSGVKKKDVVSIISPNTPEAITCFYALNKIGAICNMIHPLSAEEEIKSSIINTSSEYVIVIDMVYDKVKSFLEKNVKQTLIISVANSMDAVTKIGYYLTKGRKIKKPYGENIVFYERFLYRGKYNKVKVKTCTKGSDPAVILHSGGTTGKPKGVLLSNTNFNSLVLSEIEINKVLGPNKTILAIMPIFHGFGLGCTFHACFTAGATANILPQVNPKKFDEVILKYKPNVIACVPSILESIYLSKKLKNEDLSFIKSIVTGGDTLSKELNKKIDDFLCDHGSETKVRTAYGMTECVAGVTMMPLEETRAESIGIPCPDFDIKIKDIQTHEEKSFGEIGEICVSGPSVMLGYINEPEETEKVLKKDERGKIWLHTGDLASMDEDGFVYFKTRAKRLIISSGYNIFPSQIESVLNAHPYVKTSVVVGVLHPYKGKVPKAFIVLKDNVTLNKDVKNSIKAHAEANISKYALPYSYGYRKELPKTLIGKVAYRELINSSEEEE